MAEMSYMNILYSETVHFLLAKFFFILTVVAILNGYES